MVKHQPEPVHTAEACKGKHADFYSVLAVLQGKWKFGIIFMLLGGKKRFKELEREVPGINTRMLAKELKTMEQQGIVTRTVLPTAPPTVEYALTPKGRALKKVLDAYRVWGKQYVDAEL